MPELVYALIYASSREGGALGVTEVVADMLARDHSLPVDILLDVRDPEGLDRLSRLWACSDDTPDLYLVKVRAAGWILHLELVLPVDRLRHDSAFGIRQAAEPGAREGCLP